MGFWKKNKSNLLSSSASTQSDKQTGAIISQSFTDTSMQYPSSVIELSKNGNADCQLNNRFGAVKSALSTGTIIEGSLSFDIPVKIEGKLTGKLFSSQPVIIGPEAVIAADIDVPVLVVYGKVSGAVIAKEKVELQTGGLLEASLATPVFVMAEGAVFNGRMESLAA